jgi:hypothetical protein
MDLFPGGLKGGTQLHPVFYQLLCLNNLEKSQIQKANHILFVTLNLIQGLTEIREILKQVQNDGSFEVLDLRF